MSANAMKAIETSYKGYRFRSRLEARWAVFFDALGIAYEYEPQGYRIGWLDHPNDCPGLADADDTLCTHPDNRYMYLPDFYLRDSKTWVEVKGDCSTFNKSLLAWSVDYGFGLPGTDSSRGTTRGLLLLGPVPEVIYGWRPIHPILQHDRGGYVMDAVFGDSGLDLPRDPEDSNFFDACNGFEDDAWSLVAQHWDGGGLGFNENCPLRVARAYVAARSARFEHGECGARR